MKRLEKLCSYLNEELNDIPAEDKNVHYTNIEALVSILKDGAIKGSEYTIKTKVAENKNKVELATVRNTGLKPLEAGKIDTSELSESIDTVKFSLYTDRIMAKIRGIKKKPIAELPQDSKAQTSYIKYKFERDFKLPMPKFNYGNNFLDKYTVVEDRQSPKIKREIKIVADWCKKNNYPDKAVHEICRYYKELAIYRDFLINREREERFVLGDDGIPLDPSLMKIEIIKLPSKFWLEEYNTKIHPQASKERKIEICSTLMSKNKEAYKVLNDSNPKLLIRNGVFYKLLEIFKDNYKHFKELKEEAKQE